MARRKKQKKQVKEALDLRTFEHTEKAEELDAAFGDLALPSFSSTPSPVPTVLPPPLYWRESRRPKTDP